MTTLEHLLLLTVGGYGLCYILMYGSIFNWPRNFLMRHCKWFRNLITCSLCTGFWCGVIMFPWHCPPPMWEMDLVNEGRSAWNICKASLIFPYACYTAITCYIFHLITEILLAKAYPSINTSRSDDGISDEDISGDYKGRDF